MKIVIAGAGSVGRSVALELLAHGHDITLIDNMPEKLRISSVADADWVLADACSPDALRDAGVDEADVMVAATGDDKANLVISLLAKTEFAVPRVVARLNNPKNEWLFDQAWGVDVSASTPRIMTSLVEEAVSVGVPVRLFSFQHDAVASDARSSCPRIRRLWASASIHWRCRPVRSSPRFCATVVRSRRAPTTSSRPPMSSCSSCPMRTPQNSRTCVSWSRPTSRRNPRTRTARSNPSASTRWPRLPARRAGVRGPAWRCREPRPGDQRRLHGDAQRKDSRPHPRDRDAAAA